jgi:SAM-dependent methyltransferase
LAFADHFSQHSEQYARSRPHYPDALFAFIAAQAPARALAWDCATGSGQAALGLARHFARVEATDASAEQVRNAAPHAHVRYSVQPAERTSFDDGAYDAVCVAQALHWFDLERFYAEVKRVLRPGGVLAAWGYDWMRTARGFDALFSAAILEKLKPHWPAQNRLLWDGYRSIPFPFERIDAPGFEMTLDWTFEQLRAYAGTWTGTRRCLEAMGPNYLDDDWAALRKEWGDVEVRRFAIPLHFLCGRHGPG